MERVKKVLSEVRLRELRHEKEYAALRRDEARAEILRLQESLAKWTDRLFHWDSEVGKTHQKLEGYNEDGLDS